MSSRGEVESCRRALLGRYITWQFSVRVSGVFRIKYLLSQRPFQTLLLTILSTWLVGSICLHVLEFPFEPNFAPWLFSSFDLLTGIGWSSVAARTIGGRVVGLTISVVGILSIAVLTATLCTSSELDGTEVWLIRRLSDLHKSRAEKAAATKLISASFRSWRAAKNRSQFKALSMPAAAARAAAAYRRAHLDQIAATRQFRATKLHTGSGSNVANVKTIHGDIRTLRIQQIQLQNVLQKHEHNFEKLEGMLGKIMEKVGADNGPPGRVATAAAKPAGAQIMLPGPGGSTGVSPRELPKLSPRV